MDDHSTQTACKYLKHSVSKAAGREALKPTELGAEDHSNGDIPPLKSAAWTTICCACKYANTTHINSDYFIYLMGLCTTSKISAEHLQWNTEFNEFNSIVFVAWKSTFQKIKEADQTDQKRDQRNIWLERSKWHQRRIIIKGQGCLM